jgi:putative Mg2+ transporter-C (MgtC) family protein
MSELINHEEILIRFVFSFLLGFMIGLERDVHGRNAGLRTHLIVCLGSTLFTIISIDVSTEARRAVSSLTPVNADPGRIAAQIVSGIGFIGAGTILKSGADIRGLTTAATLWVVASIGMSVGAGLYYPAFLTTCLTIIALSILNYIEKFYHKDIYKHIEIVFDSLLFPEDIIKYFEVEGVELKTFHYSRNHNENKTTFTAFLKLTSKGTSDLISSTVIKKLEQSELKIDSVNWQGTNTL